MANSVTFRFPDYYPDFRCIGPACSDNCCHDWPIEIDKQHYLRYRGEKNPEFAALCGKYLHKIKKDASEQVYARIALDNNGRCGFQDPDGGCRMIRLLGEDILSDTCCFYPRRKNVFTPDLWEISLAMSCEEVVRIGVLAPEQIRFAEKTVPLSPGDPLHRLQPRGIGLKGRQADPPSWGPALRLVCLKLMQSRQFTIEERLAAIFLLLRRLDKLAGAGQDDQIPIETIRFLQTVEAGGLKGFLNTLEDRQDITLLALRIPMGHILAGRSEKISRKFLFWLEPHLERGHHGDIFAGKAAAQALLMQMLDRADPDMKAHEVWLENFFANYLFSTMFPFYYPRSICSFEDHALMLIQQYGILRCLLAVTPEEDPKDRFTAAMVHTARLSQHGDFPGDLRNLLNTMRLPDNMAMLYLLK